MSIFLHSIKQGIMRVKETHRYATLFPSHYFLPKSHKNADMELDGRYLMYHSFSCPKFQLPIKSPEVTIFEKQCQTKVMKGMCWQKLQVYIQNGRQRALMVHLYLCLPDQCGQKMHKSKGDRLCKIGQKENICLFCSQFFPTHSFHNLRLTLPFKYGDFW